jgi:hypothetical protein
VGALLPRKREAAAENALACRYLCVFITVVPITKLFAWGQGDSGGQVCKKEEKGAQEGACIVVCGFGLWSHGFPDCVGIRKAL